MARLRVDTEEESLGACEIEEGDNGLFLLDDGAGSGTSRTVDCAS